LGLDRLSWRERWLEVTEKAKEAMKKGQEKAASKKVPDTQPSHDLEAYAGDFNHPGYGMFKVQYEDGVLKGEYNNRPFRMEHYHYDIFEAKSEEDREDGGLPVYFHTDFQGNIASLSTPLEPNVKDIIFERAADESMREKSFLLPFVGEYDLDDKKVVVALKGEDTLTITMPNMPAMELEPYQNTEFNLKEMDVVRVEFLKGADGAVCGLEVSQPGGVFNAKKTA